MGDKRSDIVDTALATFWAPVLILMLIVGILKSCGVEI